MKKGNKEVLVRQGRPLVVGTPPALVQAFGRVKDSLEDFCLRAGLESLEELMVRDVRSLCGERHVRAEARCGYRWGVTQGAAPYRGRLLRLERPRVRGKDGAELMLPSWQAVTGERLLERAAHELMLLNVSTRKYRRALLPLAPEPIAGDGASRSAVSRRFMAMSEQKLSQWLSSDLAKLDLLAIQIDGLTVADHVLVAALGIDGEGGKHPLALVEGATENATVVQALLDDLLERGLDAKRVYLFIVDGAKALKRAIRRTFGADTPIQRCQIHKARNIVGRLPERLHRSVRVALKQAWEQDDAEHGEQMIRNLARRLEHEAPGVSKSILEGIDEILTASRLGLSAALKRSLACTNIIENANGTVRLVTRNVKRWRNAKMALRWVGAGLMEAHKTFRRLKAYRDLPLLRAALQRIADRRRVAKTNALPLAA